jgi:hypothetical protein
MWTHFCFRGLWEDEMFARQLVGPLPGTAQSANILVGILRTLRKTRASEFTGKSSQVYT